MDTAEREVLNVEQAAEFLGFSSYTVREKARAGEIPGRKVGREWRFSRDVLRQWLREGQTAKARGYVVIVVGEPEGGYSATVEGVPDIQGKGDTSDEAVQDLKVELERAPHADKYRTELPRV